MKPIRYITTCGCEVEKPGLKRVRRKENTNITICLEHGGKVTHRIRECMDCGEDYTLATRGPGGLRCKECERLTAAKRRRASRDKYESKGRRPTRKRNGWSFHWRGDYCTGIEACRMLGPLGCDDCETFVGVFFGHDPAKKVA